VKARDAEAKSTGRGSQSSVLTALIDDLMDRSRVSAVLPDTRFVSGPGQCAVADAVIVDLARHGESIAAIRVSAPAARIVAFGPHVDDEVLAKARADGADVVLTRAQFFRDPAAAVAEQA
jgi:hypothetical protein